MTIAAGTRLGVYEVAAPLGAGGMGEVYRARDTKLGRDVALKLLPGTFNRDPERLARFQREAQLLAALNHPHIGAIYGLDESAGTQFLVLELVEGETLSLRLTRGPMAVQEALAIAGEIIDALEAAHDKGIIHRDLKPSNIALTADGHVKVLDFGLAKAMDPSGLSTDASPIGVTHSPTLTLAATQAGVILGTAAYMSPEQAKGRTADKRSDVWAFACVLFEMLTGTRAFEGEDVSDTMAAVLRAEPAWDTLPADVSPAIRSLLKRCLDKDRRTRVPDLSVVRFLLEDASRAGASQPSVTVAPGPAASRSRLSAAVPWAVAAAAILLGAVALIGWSPWRTAPEVPPTRLTAELGADVGLVDISGTSIALSPDGRVLAFSATSGATARLQLFVRRLDQLEATPLAGTEDAGQPFFSPDGRWIAFFAGGKLKKIAVTGGAAVTLADAPNARGGFWTDDVITFAPSSTVALSRVSSAGGTPDPLTKLKDGENSHRWPGELPGGRVLYTVSNGGSGFNPSAAALAVRDTDGTTRELLPGAYGGHYLSSGHVVYMSNGTLFAAPIDPDKAVLTGQGVPVLESVANSSANGGVQMAFSSNGTVVYLPGQTANDDYPITWLDQAAKLPSLRVVKSNWSNPAFGPDGRRLAMESSDGTQSDIWVYEWARDTLSRLTFDAADDQRPAWTPDGRRIAFASRRADKKGAFNLYWQRADGTGEVQRLTESPNQQITGSWHPSGKFLAFTEGNDIFILPMDGDEASGWKPGKPTVFLRTPQSESSPMFSPDGRWISYLSNETGRSEIYVRPFPGPGGKWQISTGAADDPTWSPKRPELFFLSTSDLRVMVAPFTVDGDSFRADKPRVWSEGRVVGRPRPPSRDLDIHPDGTRFAIASSPEPQATAKRDRVVFVLNFFDEVRRVSQPKK